MKRAKSEDGGPPRWMEALAAILLPPACREHILGDMRERYQSPGRYFIEGARAIPFVILSRVRRVANGGTLLLEAMGMYAAFLAAGRLEEGNLAGPLALWRLAVPPAALLCALLLGDTYAQPEERDGRSGLLYAGFAALAVAVAGDSLTVSRWVAIAGGGLSLLFVAGVRLYLPHGAGHTPLATGLAFARRETPVAGRRRHLPELSAVVAILVLLWLFHQTARFYHLVK